MPDKLLRKAIKDVLDYQIALSEESDRAAAILAAADFEDWLAERITSKFVDLDQDLHNSLLGTYGPLSSFSAKVDIAFALGLYDQNIHKGLHTVRKIRNKFAHLSKPIKFHDNAIKDLCQNLDADICQNADDLRKRYLTYLTGVKNEIRNGPISEFLR